MCCKLCRAPGPRAGPVAPWENCPACRKFPLSSRSGLGAYGDAIEQLAMPPPRKPDPLHRMEFWTNSLRNTTIAVDDDAFYYEIVTRFWHPRLTKIFKLDKETREMNLVAELERPEGQEARVRFGGEHGRWIGEEEFLRWDKEKRGGTFVGGEGVEYRWKSHHRRLQLVRADDQEKNPLAKFHTYRRHFFLFRMSKHAFLEVKSEAIEAMDRLIMSYLLVERKRRETAMLRVERTYAIPAKMIFSLRAEQNKAVARAHPENSIT